eukprot:TRINITY_DN2519_c0_g1_i1.p1 TRINITY_DN2519_c0_g1~~TRINITY_DN2519_c0_g1_i1.p1  ORF type:complete len:137 (+),score=39.79 TRINITY_DN2519_c0_g1_i1:478-888(+)
MLIEGKADINLQNKSGFSPLMRAAANGYSEIVQMLIQEKANLNLVDNDGWTALIFAIRYADKDICLDLINAKADHTMRQKYGLDGLAMARHLLSEPGWSDERKRVWQEIQRLLESLPEKSNDSSSPTSTTSSTSPA